VTDNVSDDRKHSRLICVRHVCLLHSPWLNEGGSCMSQLDNLLVHEDGRVLLADFGATANLERIEVSSPSPRSNASLPSLGAIAGQDPSTDSGSAYNPSEDLSTPSVRCAVQETLACPQDISLGSNTSESYLIQHGRSLG
jgi:hypothetical protein